MSGRKTDSKASGNASAAPARSLPPELLRFNTLPTFKLDVLAALVGKHGELLYEREVGLRLVECRMVGVVGRFGPVTLRQACLEIGIDKGQGSRMVARMLEAGWMERRDDPADQRSFYLLLTPEGQRLRDRIVTVAAARNNGWMGCLNQAQQMAFVESLDLLTRQAQQMLADETAMSGEAQPALPMHQKAEPAPPGERPLLVAPSVLRDLQKRLGELLGDG